MSRGKREHKRFMKKTDKKEEIIRATIRLIAEKTFDTILIKEIAKIANVSDGLIFYYFCCKEHILLSIHLTFWQELNYELSNLLYLSNLKSSQKKLEAIVNLILLKLAGDKDALCLFKILTEQLPSDEYCNSFDEERKNILFKQKQDIDIEKKKIYFFIDSAIKSISNKSDKEIELWRMAFIGAFISLLNGFFNKSISLDKDNYPYGKKEIREFMNKFISLIQ